MAKFKPVRKNSGKNMPANPGALPCVVIVVTGMILLSLLFYWVLSSGK